ncbi:site-specific integrase [Pseudonocardia sp. KRD-184]|uniref:Site-specific integrase n=1 Tax=Pseudonocardia oceani TaxID=2792013 RepID=A0ABS6U3C5_9PSEU|nr:site-specific integrase [Pseudonocardia oceani]MBW0088741.1 site-specific integrase [Pseudonocardia oceani]MBW0094670.1 site-specific integrase [Pseudonocardia oceani]MBW0119808.1 site-specific integrase [Pseudonocardia oceani]MBW0126676.1 site-specific integrase [Pseudonocardia oceani]
MTGRARANGEGSIFAYRNGFAAYSWVRTPAGRRQKKWVYGKTREHVHDKWIVLQQRAKAGPVANRVPTLGEHLHYWLDEVVRPNLAPLTYQTYETIVRLYIEPALGTKRLDRLQLRDVQTWINGTARACQCCVQGKDARRPPDKQRCCAVSRCCQTTISPRTLSDIRGCLRSALGQAVTEELISRNVAAVVKLPKVRSRSNRRQAWTSDEARRFLESARADDDPLYAAYVLILVLGLRKGEVLGLTWATVDIDRCAVKIALQLQRVSRQLLHRETKTEGSDAALPLPDICVAALRLRCGAQQGARAAAGSAWRGNDLIFTTRFGTPIEPRNFNRSWDARCRKADVRKITVHDGRRSCGTLLADLDVHPRVAMQILRHAQFALTMEIYTLASPQATKEALKRLGASLDR